MGQSKKERAHSILGFRDDFVFRIEMKSLLIFFVSIGETDNAIWYRIVTISGWQLVRGCSPARELVLCSRPISRGLSERESMDVKHYAMI